MKLFFSAGEAGGLGVDRGGRNRQREGGRGEATVGIGSDAMAARPRCALCGESGDCASELMSIGGVLQSIGPLLGPFGHDTYVHRLCALWSPEVYHENDKIRNVMAAVRRGKQLKCSLCGMRGATVGCCVDSCSRTYHIRCAEKAGCDISALEWILTCPEHARSMRNHLQSKEPAAPKEVVKLEGGWVGTRVTSSHAGKGGKAASKRPRDQIDPLRLLKTFGEQVDVDEEMWRKKQQRRVERDIKALKPYRLGSSGTTETQDGKADPPAGPTGSAQNRFFGDATDWDDVGGHEGVKRALKEAVLLPLIYRDEFLGLNLSCPRGVLLHGEPGTGKTMVVRALAGECNRHSRVGRVSFFSRKGADLLGKFQGEAERKLRLLFQEAQKASPSIIFFDELDGIAPARGGKVSDQIHTSVVSTLLSLMDGLVDRGKVVVIAATNRADAIDPALRRPGRFDREVYFALPERPQRLQILEACTRKWDPKPRREVLERMASLTNGFAGADLQSLCTSAALARLRREFPTILDGVEQSRRVPDFESRLDRVEVGGQDFMRALQGMTSACSHRTSAGMLESAGGGAVPCYALDAVWRPLLGAVSALRGEDGWGSASHLAGDGGRCPEAVRRFLEEAGAVSNRMVISSAAAKMMPRGDGRLAGGSTVPGTSVLVCGEASANSVVAESLLCALPGFRVAKVSLPQVVREGHDSVAEGVIGLTRRALGAGKSCKVVLYCPNVHDWLRVVEPEQSEGGSTLAVWDSFTTALRDKPEDSEVVVVATSAAPVETLPSKVRAFFEDPTGKARWKAVVSTGHSGGVGESLAEATSEYLVAATRHLLEAVSSAGEEEEPSHSVSQPRGPPSPAPVPVPVPAEEEEAQPVARGHEGTPPAGAQSSDPKSEYDEVIRVGVVAANSLLDVKLLQCCVSLESLDADAEVRCREDGCPAAVHPRCLPHLPGGGTGSRKSSWTCGLCRLRAEHSEEDAKEILRLERETCKLIGSTLLKDHRCGLSHVGGKTAIAFLDIASNASKGKYARLEYLRAAAKLALDAMLQRQSSVDRAASQRGLARKYFVSTSAAFATADKIESICWKFNGHVQKKFARVEDGDPSGADLPAATEEGDGGGRAKEGQEGASKIGAEGPRLQPTVFEMSREAPPDGELVAKVSERLAVLLRMERIGDYGDHVGRILRGVFASISNGECSDAERAVLGSIERCLGGRK